MAMMAETVGGFHRMPPWRSRRGRVKPWPWSVRSVRDADFFQKGGEDERHPRLHLLIRILGHDTGRIARQTGRQDQPEVAACRLAVQVRRPRRV